MTLRSLLSRLSSPSTAPAPTPVPDRGLSPKRQRGASPSGTATSRRSSPAPTYTRRGKKRSTSSDRSTSRPSTPTSDRPRSSKGFSRLLRIQLPLYIYPTPTSWIPLYEQLSKHPDVQFDIVINPASGPGPQGSFPDANYAAELTKLNSFPNVRLFGYVHVSWGERPLEHVLRDIRTYQGWNTASPASLGDGEGADGDDRAQMRDGPSRSVRSVSPSTGSVRSLNSATATTISSPGRHSEGLKGEIANAHGDAEIYGDHVNGAGDAGQSASLTIDHETMPSLQDLMLEEAGGELNDHHQPQPRPSPVRKTSPSSHGGSGSGSGHSRRPSPLRNCISPTSPISPNYPPLQFAAAAAPAPVATTTQPAPTPPPAPKTDMHISGIFVDEAPHHERHLSYMTTLYASARRILCTHGATVWTNPGCPVSGAYYAVSDRVTAFEDAYGAWIERGLKGMEADVPVAGSGSPILGGGARAKKIGVRRQKGMSGVMVHSVPRNGKEIVEVVKKAAEEGVEGIFVTNERGYEAWGVGWAELIKAVAEHGVS